MHLFVSYVINVYICSYEFLFRFFICLFVIKSHKLL